MDGWIKQGCDHHSLVGHLQVLLEPLSTAESMDICGGQSSLILILQQLDLKSFYYLFLGLPRFPQLCLTIDCGFAAGTVEGKDAKSLT